MKDYHWFASSILAMKKLHAQKYNFEYYLSAMNNTSDVFRIGGVSVKDLANEFGTPLYVYHAEKISEQIKRLRSAFPEKTSIRFAAKALTSLAILDLMRKEGVGLDCVSIQEVKLGLQAGFNPSSITYTPNNVSIIEVEEAVALGAEITLDNLPILKKFGEQFGNKVPAGIRLNPNIMAGGNLKISTGHSHSKFGISILQMEEIQSIVGRHNININGLHIHTGSELKDHEVFMNMANILFDAAVLFPNLKFLDFGGGFKVAYRDNDAVTDIGKVGALLGERLKEFNSKNSKSIELRIEPGKFLVSEAGFLITEVTVIKETPSVTFVGVNTGLNHLIRPMMYDAWHDIINGTNQTGQTKTYTVTGNICETDTFGKDRILPEVKEGDLLVMLNAGAYGYSMASNYNSRFRPAEVLIKNGKAFLIRRRDTMEDLTRGQIIPS